MKTFIFLLLSAFTGHVCHAQYFGNVDHPKYVRIKRDTIHIRGVVVDEFNNPASDFFVVSKNKEIEFYGFPLYTKTDTAGKFELDGALVTDTLEVWWYRKKFSIVNKGSRYLEITLPGTLIDTVNIPGSVTAKRVVRKKAPPVFKVLLNANIADYFGLPYQDHPYAYPPGGFRTFQSMVNQQIIYPEKAIKNNIEGEVKIGFSIGTDGMLGRLSCDKRHWVWLRRGCDNRDKNVVQMAACRAGEQTGNKLLIRNNQF